MRGRPEGSLKFRGEQRQGDHRPMRPVPGCGRAGSDQRMSALRCTANAGTRNSSGLGLQVNDPGGWKQASRQAG